MAKGWAKGRGPGTLCWALTVALLLWAARSAAFPALYVGKDDAPRFAETTQVVLMLGADISVVSVMADYEGPLTPFALLMPVPSDVVASRVSTIKRRFVTRLEQLSAPRFHTFYEQDPCFEGPVEQQWEEHKYARGRGFLAPPYMPPVDAHYKVPNELSRPTDPLFKGSESEFVYHVLPRPSAAEVRGWLRGKGYRMGGRELESLEPYLRDNNLLIAEVRVGWIELLGPRRAQLGAIRYWSRRPSTRIASRLGLLNARGEQDLIVYVLHPGRRFEAKNYENVFLPTNVGVEIGAARRLSRIYNALFDVQRSRTPGAMIHEFAWSTEGCGEPCQNAPLDLRELMSLGADVVESQTVPPAERIRAPPPETDAEKAKLDDELSGLEPAEAARERREHEQTRKELFRRRSLARRHTYVLSRMHVRYGDASLPRDIEIGPATQAVQGGVGVPVGPGAVLDTDARPAAANRFQMRFFATRPWSGAVSCNAPERWRWGKRWASLALVWRAVTIAQDLPRAGRNREALVQVLRTPLPGLGLGPASPAKSAPSAGSGDRRQGGGCSLSRAAMPSHGGAIGLGGLVLLGCLLTRAKFRRRGSGMPATFRARTNRRSSARVLDGPDRCAPAEPRGPSATWGSSRRRCPSRSASLRSSGRPGPASSGREERYRPRCPEPSDSCRNRSRSRAPRALRRRTGE